MRIKQVKPEYIRMAVQAATARKSLKFPSPEWETFIAQFLNGLVETEHITTTVDIWK